jgi:hypothetical protein
VGPKPPMRQAPGPCGDEARLTQQSRHIGAARYDRSGDATHLLGLAGLAVECVPLPRLDEDRTAGHRGSGAARCRAVADIDVVERVGVYPAKDLACVGEPVVLLWRKHRWSCRTAGCPVQTFTEQRGCRYRPGCEGPLDRRRGDRWPGSGPRSLVRVGVLADGAGGAGCLCAGRTRRARADQVLGLD